jgi:nucleoside-diphosphate-sugar epimerase
VRGDLQNLRRVVAACVNIDVVFHVASKTGAWGDWEDFYQTNVEGTGNVLAACRKQGVPKLVYTSSPSVVFDNRPQEGVDESLPYPEEYESHYAQTKARAEQLVRFANQPELLTVSLRPHLVFGPRDNHLLPGLIARARTGKLPQVGGGKNRVDLTYVEDAARAHLLAADALAPGSPVAGSVYFISQDEPVNLWGFIRQLTAALDLPPIRRRLPLGVVRAAGAALEFIYDSLPLEGEPFITRFLASEVAMSHYYDISRAKRDLGYAPVFTMEEALQRTLPYLRQLV